MPRKSIWATLILAMLLACIASLRMAPTASASPTHAAQHNASLIVSGCPVGQTLEVILSTNNTFSVYNNYSSSCVSGDDCQTLVNHNFNELVCLYENSNYGGHEIAFWGVGCANLTDFAGPGPGGTWNDAMSSFRILPGAIITGAFWWDTNDSGYYYLYGSTLDRSSGTSYIGATWNDQTSSVEIDDPRTGTHVPGC